MSKSVLLLIALHVVPERFCSNFLIIFLQGRQILTSLRELSLLHTFSDIPVYESSFGVHHVELVVDAAKHLCDGGGVRNHANRALDLRKVPARDHSRWLVVDADLESGRTPVYELNRSFC